MSKRKLFIIFVLLITNFSRLVFAADPYAARTRTLTTAFNNHLSAADTDVQKALDTLDNWTPISVGSPLPGAVANEVFYADSAAHLAQDAGFLRSATDRTLTLIAAANKSAIVLQGDLDGGTGTTDPLIWKNRAGSLTLGSLGGYLSEGMFSLTGDSTDGATGGQIGEWNVLDRNRTVFGSDKRVLSLQVRNQGLVNDDTYPYDFSISQAGYGRAILVDLTNQRTGFNIDAGLPKNTVDVRGAVNIGNDYVTVYTAPTNGLLVEGHAGFGTATPDASSAITARAKTYFQDPPTDFTATENFGTGNYMNGDDVTFYIYAGLYTDAGTVYNYSIMSASIHITADFSSIDLSWTGAPGISILTGFYAMKRDYNGSGADAWYITSNGGTTSLNDDNTFWIAGAYDVSATSADVNFRYGYDDATNLWSVYSPGGKLYVKGITSVGNVGVNTNEDANIQLLVSRQSNNYSAIQINGSKHTSTLPSAMSVNDENGYENVGFTSWDGGGGDGGYGAVVLGNHVSSGDARLMEISPRNTYNSLRLGSFIGATDGAIDKGRFDFYLNDGVSFIHAASMASTGYVGLSGVTAPTARVDIGAGSTSIAPFRISSGSLRTSPHADDIEHLTDKWYGVIQTGTARKEFTLNDAALTSGRVPIATTNGRLTDDSDLTFSTDTLTATKVSSGTVISTGVIRLKGYTVATLPAGTIGDTAYVTDALAPTFLAAVVGGGAVVTPVFYNGANWVGY